MSKNWAGAGSGAISGAGTGAAIGSAVPGIGTGIGALIGGLLGGTAGLFSGGAKNDKLKKLPTRTPEQEALHANILANAMGLGQNGGVSLANQYYNNLLGENQQEAYNQFASPYLQEFQENILPMIGERFAGAGALSSSGFGQALGGASAGLQSKLAQLFSQLQGQAAGAQYDQYNQLAGLGLGHKPFAYEKRKGSLGFGGPFAAGVSDNMEGILSGIASLFKQTGGQGSQVEWGNYGGEIF